MIDFWSLITIKSDQKLGYFSTTVYGKGVSQRSKATKQMPKNHIHAADKLAHVETYGKCSKKWTF